MDDIVANVLSVINFIVIFLLLDFFNGIFKNSLGKKLKSGILVIMAFCVVAAAISAAAWAIRYGAVILTVLEVMTVAAVMICKCKIKRLITYKDEEQGKEPFFGNKKVMFIVPHEDDELNIAGGVIEEYIKHSSEVYVVFATNGDGRGDGDLTEIGRTRLREAIDVLTGLGVCEKNIIFLGYGDGWADPALHIYNAPDDMVLTSAAGRQATYGLDEHPAYRGEEPYTRGNFISGLKGVIANHRPDVIFCIDYDSHKEHRALSMFFENVMGDLIKTTDYRPTVYKGYAYRTSHGGPRDFNDSYNIGSTAVLKKAKDIELYEWGERIRLPIDVNSVSRKLTGCRIYKTLAGYDSQNIALCAESIINGDKVVWQRRTDSLCYTADIKVSSGNGGKLNDFMLLDCDDLANRGNEPYDGVWHPDESDSRKTAVVSFQKAEYVDHIVLYDSPSPADNVLDAVVCFDDGTCVSTGKLVPSGTRVPVGKKILAFSVRLKRYEGEKFGLAEIEAYSKPDAQTDIFYKLEDEDGNFAYDYILPQSGEQTFRIYSNRRERIPDVKVRADGRGIRVNQDGDTVKVQVPAGKKCRVSLYKDNECCETVVVRNPGGLDRKLLKYCLSHRDRFTLKKCYLYRLFRRI